MYNELSLMSIYFNFLKKIVLHLLGILQISFEKGFRAVCKEQICQVKPFQHQQLAC
jgi:hypothetical protein